MGDRSHAFPFNSIRFMKLACLLLSLISLIPEYASAVSASSGFTRFSADVQQFPGAFKGARAPGVPASSAAVVGTARRA